MLFSNAPHAQTGYGVQTALLASRLRDAGHQVAIHAYWGVEGARMIWDGIPVFPRSRHHSSQDMMTPLATELGVDAVISITDAWVIEPQRFKACPRMAYVPWFPVDAGSMDGPTVAGINGPGPAVRYPVATSEHARAAASAAGVEDVHTIRYMVDTEVFQPRDRAESRKEWMIPESAFVVGMVAMNKTAAGVDRKRFFEQMAAFSVLRQRHDDAILYLHTNPVAPDGVSIPEIMRLLGLPAQSVRFTEGIPLTIGVPPQIMSGLFSSFDVLLGCTAGEGAGMPLLEAAACGVPTIWGEWTAAPEYAKAGWPVAIDEAQPMLNPSRTLWWSPSIDAIADRLEKAYDATAAERKVLADMGRAGAMDHDADAVVRDQWLPALDEISERIAALDQVQEIVVPPELAGAPGVAA